MPNLKSRTDTPTQLPVRKRKPSEMKLRQGNIFTSVCQEFCSRGGVSASVHGVIHPPGRHPRVDTPQADTPRPVHAGIDIATAADGTHPTGMHFVCKSI